MKPKVLLMLLTLLITLSSLVPANAALADTVELSDCHVRYMEAKAQCAYINVPENWDEPHGKQISLFVAVVPPSGGQPVKHPIYMLAGGPGQAASTLGPNVEIALERARRGREVVLIDQRGTGKSTPFGCVMSADPNVKGDEFARECLSKSDNRSEFYHSAAFMRDLDHVRQRLGHERINVMGGSYGTRAALLYLRAYPQHVRSLVLDAVAAPETAFFEQFHLSASRALDNLLADCKADSDCRAAYPNVEQQLANVLVSLDLNPVDIDASPEPFTLTADVFLNILRNALYAPLATAQLPMVIDAAANGEFAPLVALSGGMSGVYLELSIGTMLSVMCGEEVGLTSRAHVDTLSRGSRYQSVPMDFWFDACRVWPHTDAPADYREPVRSDVPVLLLSGELDPVTPPAFAEEAARRLTRARHIVAPYGGHTISAYGCVPRLVAEFLDALDPEALDASCLDALSREPFVVSAFGPRP